MYFNLIFNSVKLILDAALLSDWDVHINEQSCVFDGTRILFMQEGNLVGCLRAAWSSPAGTAARTGIGMAGALPKMIKAPRHC